MLYKMDYAIKIMDNMMKPYIEYYLLMPLGWF